MFYSIQSAYEHQLELCRKVDTLKEVSGYDIDTLIDLFAKGFTLKGPEPPVSLESFATPYRSKYRDKTPIAHSIKAKRGY